MQDLQFKNNKNKIMINKYKKLYQKKQKKC